MQRRLNFCQFGERCLGDCYQLVEHQLCQPTQDETLVEMDEQRGSVEIPARIRVHNTCRLHTTNLQIGTDGTDPGDKKLPTVIGPEFGNDSSAVAFARTRFSRVAAGADRLRRYHTHL